VIQLPHVKEETNCSQHGGASLNILSAFEAAIFRLLDGIGDPLLMFHCLLFLQNEGLLAIMPAHFTFASPNFAFGLVAFAS
jgi:K(+)-stimulated pyrophosphate-energized sodium pump